jgi:hypothetical protein
MGQYTNGFNATKVMNALVGRLGWKQPDWSTNGTAPVLNATNLESRSSRYFNDGSFHPLVTIDNIKETIEQPDIADDALNNLIEDLQKSIIMQSLTAVFNKPELIDNTMLFERSLNNDQLITLGDQFVGIRFKLAPGNIAAQINSISLYFNEAVSFNLYLFHDVKTDALWSQPVVASANDQTIIIPTDELILSQYKSGYFYLGYFTDELGTAKPYYEQYCRNKTLALGFDFIQAERSGASFNKVSTPITGYNFGLNAEIISFTDHTDKIIRNAHLFDNIQGLQMAYHTAKQMLFCTRSNRNERILKDAYEKMGLQYELEGSVPQPDVPKSTGLQKRIDQELVRLKETFFPKAKAQTVSLEC